MLDFQVGVTGVEQMLRRFGPGVWQEQAEQVHRAATFRVIRWLVRTTPVATGRARSGWCAVLRHWKIDEHRQYLDDTSLVGGVRAGAIKEDTTAGMFVDEPLRTAIVNNVFYVERLNEGGVTRVRDLSDRARRFYWANRRLGKIGEPSGEERKYAGFVDRAMDKANEMMGRVWTKWAEKVSQESGVPAVTPATELVRSRLVEED